MTRKRSRNFRKDTTSFLLGGDGDASHSNWAISYGDMVTLLLCFFVLFFGSRSHTRLQMLKKKLKQITPTATPASTEPLAQSPSTTSTISAGSTAGRGGATTAAASNSAKAKGKGGGPAVAGILARAWKNLSALEHTQLMRDNSNLVVEFPDVSFFNFSQTKLTSQGRKELATFAKAFAPFQDDLKLVVIGYTDAVQVSRQLAHKRGRHFYTDNLELSALRGVSAVRYLHNLGLATEHMRVGGEGEWKSAARLPASAAHPDAAARRIVLIVQAQGDESQ